MGNEVQEFYGNRLRVRACGICVIDDAILLVNHKGISQENFWTPPGGGIQFGESAADCLQREFREETGLSIVVHDHLFNCEFIQLPLHAIELFFQVSVLGGRLSVGNDPEPGSPNIITDVRFTTWSAIAGLPAGQLHGIFRVLDHPSEITALRGHFKL